MAIDEEILDILESRELSVKNLAIELDHSPTSLYKPLAGLVQEGLIKKREKESQGKMIAFYSIPSEEVIEGCSWQSHKEVLLAGRTYQKKVLEYDFWDSLSEDLSSLGEREENRHVAVVGLVGIGKSNTAIFLARVLDPSFDVKGIIFTKERLLGLVANQPTNKSFVFDDVGVMLSSRGWQEKERGLIFSWLEICRMHRINTIATSPSLAMIDVNYQRLLHYVFQVELKCKGHIHIIVFKPTQAGLKPLFKPIGTLTFALPEEPFSSIFQEYLAIKQKELSLSARASLERLESAKEGVQEYIQGREVTRVTDDVVRSALHTIGLDGNLPKQEKDNLRTVMYDSLQEKRQREKKAKQEQNRIGTENLKRARLDVSFKNRYQGYIDQGRSEQFAKTLSYRLVYEKEKAGHLKNLQGAMSSLFKKVQPGLVENLILSRLDNAYLIKDLRAMKSLLGSFRGFEHEFYTKLFSLMVHNPERGLVFVKRVGSARGDFRYHGKPSPKQWREYVVVALAGVIQNERLGWIYESGARAIIGLGALIAKKPDWVAGALYGQKKFWGDV